MAGALGTLPCCSTSPSGAARPGTHSLTLASFECDMTRAIEIMNGWSSRPLPISATAFDGKRLYARLEGSGKQSRRRRISAEDRGKPTNSGAPFANTVIGIFSRVAHCGSIRSAGDRAAAHRRRPVHRMRGAALAENRTGSLHPQMSARCGDAFAAANATRCVPSALARTTRAASPPQTG